MTGSQRFLGPARLIAVLTLGSRVLGLIREIAYSHYFGATPFLSAFRVAFQVPNLARRLFGEGALTASFIPIFSRCRTQQGEEAARQLAGSVFTLVAVVLTALLVLIEIILLVTGRFAGGLTLTLTALLMPYMLLICLTAFFGGLLNALNRFAAPAMAPMALNICIIIAAWAGGALFDLPPRRHLYLIGGAVLVAGALQLAIQIAWLRRMGFSLRLNLTWTDPLLRRIVRLMTPMMLGLSAVQINTLADSLIALWFVPDGKGPAVLGYAQYLYHLPLGVFGTALATAIFPLLSARAAAKDTAGLTDAIVHGLRVTSFISIPAGAGLIAVATPTIRVLFEFTSAAFTAADTQRVATALMYYSAGIWAYALQHVLIRGFYATEDSRTPVRIATWMVGLNVVLNLVLVRWMAEAGVALATVITAFLQVGLLMRSLHRHLQSLPWSQLIPAVARSIAASAAMVIVVLIIRGQTPAGQLLPDNELIQLPVAIVAGAITYIVVSRLLGSTELGQVLRRERP